MASRLKNLVMRAAVSVRRVGAPVAPPVVRFSVPGSDVSPHDLYDGRRGTVGGTFARGWAAIDQGGTTYVFSVEHNGSRANPVGVVAALAGATHNFVDLGTATSDSAATAAAFVAAMTAAGVTGASTDGVDSYGHTILQVVNATNLQLPPDVDMTDRAIRGMFGMQRDHWGEPAVSPIVQNLNGGTGGIGSVHLGRLSDDLEIPSGRRARILGAYIWAHGGFRPRLSVSTGPAHSLTPTAMTLLHDGRVPAGLGDGEFVFVPFLDPVLVDTDTVLWWHYHEDGVGGPRFRFHAQTPVGRGNLGADENLLWDTASPRDAANSLPTSYAPNVTDNFGIYVAGGVVFEVEDDDGNFPATGEIDDWVGDQNTDPAHGVPFPAGPDILLGETTHHRFRRPSRYRLTITAIRRAWQAIATTGANRESSRMCFYGPWADLDLPATTPPPLIADAGLMVPTDSGVAYTVTTLSQPVEIGNDVVGEDAVTSLGFNYVTEDGSPLHTAILRVFIDDAVGSGSWSNAWEDSRTGGHDDIIGWSNRGYVSGVSEYRTRGQVRTTPGMPEVANSDLYPDPLVTDPTDDSPPAIAMDATREQRPGLVAA